MIESKHQIGETKISIRKVILTGGRNVSVVTGQTQVYIEIISFFKDKTRKTKRIPTGIYVSPKDWDSKIDDGYIKTTDPDHRDKNTTINGMWGQYVSQISGREKGTWDPSFNPERLVSLENMFPKKTKHLLDYIDDYISIRREMETPRNTLKEFVTVKNRLIRYEESKGVKLTFSDMNMSFSDSLYTFLLKEKFQTGTIEKTFTILKTVLNFYYDRREDYNINNLTDKFRSKTFKRGEKSENDPRPLTREQFNVLVNHSFKDPQLSLTRKRFLLQCSTGMRYSDLFTVTPDKIVNDTIVYYPEKTRHKRNNKVEVPLTEISRTILQEYQNDSTKLRVSNQKFNDGLEKMWNKLNEEYQDKNIKFEIFTSHNGRDTFITYCIEEGIPVPTILKMSGQSSYDVMKRYFKSTTSRVKEQMTNIDIFNGK